MYNNGNSSKNVTGASVVDGTLENADFADNGLLGDKIDGGIISNFQSTGIDDRGSTAKRVCVNDTGFGIGTTNPVSKSTIALSQADNAQTSTTTLADSFQHYGAGEYALGRYFLTTYGYSNGGKVNSGAYMGALGASSAGGGKYNLVFGTRDVTTDTAPTERMRIDSSGKVLVGMTSSTGTGIYFMKNNGNSGYASFNQTGGNGVTTISFKYSGSQVGQIYTNTSSTVFATSSDYRLKEDEQPMVGSVDRLKALNPINFAWKLDGARTDGFLAHEAQEVVPECATGTKDAMKTEEYEVTPAVEEVLDADGNVTTEAVEAVMATREVEDYQGIDQSKLVPLLVSALQEAIARIETLENA